MIRSPLSPGRSFGPRAASFTVPIGIRVVLRPKRRTPRIREDAELLWLIERAQAGNERAISELLSRYDGLMRKVGASIRAGDGYEELRLKTILAVRRYLPRPGVTFGAWLKQVLGRSAIDHSRKWNRRDGRASFTQLTDRMADQLVSGGEDWGAEFDAVLDG
ncbi:MAG TPA: sigma factor [Fimbriimonadaceae bacterium]|nr:sigma factor [Fimbriimonadaceae bacterium]